MRSPQRLQQRLQRAVDAVIQASRLTRGPEALAACASAEHELAMLQQLVHAMKLDGQHAPPPRPSRISADRISIH